MRAVLKAIRNALIIIIVIGFLLAGLDYVRMNSGEVPIFNISSFDSKTSIQTYRGFFYVAERKVKASTNEPLVDSSNISFKILTFDLKVPRKFTKEDTFTVETEVISNCHEKAKLYYANLKVKVYLYCLDSINLKDGKNSKPLSDYIAKNWRILDDIDSKLNYVGLHKDKTTLMFFDKNDDFTNNGLTMYRCHKQNINDVYFAPDDTRFMDDFCTYKDDDFKFIFEIEDLSEKPEPEVDEEGNEIEIPKEIFYSDNEYDYVFEYAKKDKITIIQPAIRGRAERKYSLQEVLNKKMLTIEELKEKGLKFEKIAKKKGE